MDCSIENHDLPLYGVEEGEERASGFYWVKLKDFLRDNPFPHREVRHYKGWVVAEYRGSRIDPCIVFDHTEVNEVILSRINHWFIGQCFFHDHCFEEIGPYLGTEPETK